LVLTAEQLADLSAVFSTIDANGDGSLNLAELGQALKLCDVEKPQHEVRKLISDYELEGHKDGKLDMEEFKALYLKLYSEKQGFLHGKISSAAGVASTTTFMDTAKHTVRDEEVVGFSNWINSSFGKDSDFGQNYKINEEKDKNDLYDKLEDGVLLCKLINQAVPDTIDERTVNKRKGSNLISIFQSTENQNLAINSASAIGCNVVNIGAGDIKEKKPHLVLGLLWQVIRIGLLSEIDLMHHPELMALAIGDETAEDLLKLGPEAILLRWVNYHLAKAGVNREIKNFTEDIKDSEAYTHLLHQIQPRDQTDPSKRITLDPLRNNDHHKRAEGVLDEADKIDCRSFVSPNDIVNGNYKLNLAFVANLFNKYPALDPVDDTPAIIETREEKTYRNWMNSLGVKPGVNYLYSDLSDGLVIFQLYDIISPGIVDWKKRVQTLDANRPARATMQKLENCNYAVELGKECKFHLVGIDGNDIREGNKTLTLALVWQLMRAYTLSILKNLGDGHPVVEAEIIKWANQTLADAGKSSSLKNFQDSSLSDGKTILDLIDALQPGSVNYDFVKPGNDDEEKEQNAKYAVSMARKIGAAVYALPEDITEVKQKMIMTIFACLMVKGMQPAEVTVA
jgi:plastin-3